MPKTVNCPECRKSGWTTPIPLEKGRLNKTKTKRTFHCRTCGASFDKRA